MCIVDQPTSRTLFEKYELRVFEKRKKGQAHTSVGDVGCLIRHFHVYMSSYISNSKNAHKTGALVWGD